MGKDQGWFDGSMVNEGGVACINLHQLHMRLRALPTDLVQLWSHSRSALEANLNACAARYGWRPEDCRAKRQRGVSGRHGTKAWTKPMVAELLWDLLARALNAYVVRATATKPTRKNATITATQWDAAARFLSERMLESCDGITTTSTIACAETVQNLCACAAGVHIDDSLVSRLLAPVCVGGLADPSDFLARTFVRSDLLHHIVGVGVAGLVVKFAHGDQFQLDAGGALGDDPNVMQILLQELVATRQELSELKGVCFLIVSSKVC